MILVKYLHGIMCIRSIRIRLFMCYLLIPIVDRWFVCQFWLHVDFNSLPVIKVKIMGYQGGHL